MSIPMETQHLAAAEDSVSEEIPSNPTEIYEILKDIGDEGYLDLVDSVTKASDWRNDKTFMLSEVGRNGHILWYATDELKGDYDFMSTAVRQNGCRYALNYAPRKVVLEVVSQNDYALSYVSDELKEDKEVVLAAVRNNASALNFQNASDELKADKEIVLEVVKSRGAALQYLSLIHI